MNHGNNFNAAIFNFKKKFRAQSVIIRASEKETEKEEKEENIESILSKKKEIVAILNLISKSESKMKETISISFSIVEIEEIEEEKGEKQNKKGYGMTKLKHS
jgi:hypothetical protein